MSKHKNNNNLPLLAFLKVDNTILETEKKNVSKYSFQIILTKH